VVEPEQMRLRKFLRKVHRWIGILASVWLLLLATTGFLLQHKDDWNLDEKYTNSSLFLSFYDIGEQFISFEHEQQSLAQLDHQIYLNKQAVYKAEQAIVGAIYQQPNWIIATATQILWLDKQGHIIQTMDEMDGIPMPIKKLGNTNERIFIQNSNQTISLDTFEPTKNTINWSQVSNSQILKDQLITQSSQNYLSYQQLIFDLHAGITSPSLLNDIAALALIFLSISGIMIFFKKSFKSQKNSKQNKVK
jgi:hypothetical protein